MRKSLLDALADTTSWSPLDSFEEWLQRSGWQPDPIADETTLRELRELAKEASRFAELLEVYAGIDSESARHVFLEFTRTGLQHDKEHDGRLRPGAAHP